MCGICGQINFSKTLASEENIRLMMQKMKHRGPDDEGTYFNNNIGLGFVRLSIIDLSASGHQPMFSKDGKYVIVYNGEIYNYLELREELKDEFVFTTGTDTEVLLAAYSKWGEECMHHFNGMFSFVIYNIETGDIFGARDRFGVKPFYYFIDQNQFYFASEVNTLLCVLPEAPKVNEKIVYDYLVHNSCSLVGETFFANIQKLDHGCCFNIKNNKFSTRKWYHLQNKISNKTINAEEYLTYLEQSVLFRLRSEVPVGVCLSGGLDSSAITSLLLHQGFCNDKENALTHNQNQSDKKSNGSLNTFSVVFNKGEKGDESEYIDEYKSLISKMHSVKLTHEDFFNDINTLIESHAEPFRSTSIYAQYKVMDLAKGKAVVLLDGQGADEQLAGYTYFFGFYFKELFLNFKWGKLWQEYRSYLKNHKNNYAIKVFLFLMLPVFLKKIAKRYKNSSSLNKAFKNKHQDTSTFIKNNFESGSLKQSMINHFDYKLEELLRWEDINSMHFSIESRVPFLDFNLVEATLSLPLDSIIKNGTTKHILREAMKGILPEKIRMRQDKIGFQTPEDEWFKTEKFKKMILEILESESFAKRGYVDSKKAIHLYKQHLNDKINISMDIWKWINLELWCRKFIDQKSN